MIFGVCPPGLRGDGIGGGGEVCGGCEGDCSGGVEGECSVDRGGVKSRRPPIFEGVGLTIGCSEEVRAAPRSEGLGAGRWCDGGRVTGVGEKD